MARKRTKPGKIRLTEVAKLAGVSPITASRFFRTPEALSLDKRVAGRERGQGTRLCAQSRGTRAGLAAHRGDRRPDPLLTNNVFSDVLRGIYDARRRQPLQHPACQYALQHPAGREAAARVPGAEAGRPDRHRHRPDAGIALDDGSHRLPDRADHGNRRQSGRHDDRLFACGCLPRSHFAPARRRAAAASASSARAWTRGCSAASSVTSSHEGCRPRSIPASW